MPELIDHWARWDRLDQINAIDPATCWAPVSPKPKRSQRWILYQMASSTKRECREKMTRDYPPGSGPASWEYWRKRGWTIERVVVGVVR